MATTQLIREKPSKVGAIPSPALSGSGSTGLQRSRARTLSLRPAIAEPVGSPLDERRVGPTLARVKQWQLRRQARRPPLRQPRLKKGSAQDVVGNREVNHDASDIDERRHERRRRRRMLKSEAAQKEREHGADHAPPEHHADQTQRHRRSYQRVMSRVECLLRGPEKSSDQNNNGRHSP